MRLPILTLTWLVFVSVVIMPGRVSGLEMSDEVKSAFAEAELVDPGGYWFTDSPSSERAAKLHTALQTWFKDHWPEIIRNFKDLFTTQKDRVLIIEVAEVLPPEEYIEFLNLLYDEVIEGHVPQEIAESTLTGDNKKRGFLAYNFDEPSIQKLFVKALKAFEKNTVALSFIADAQAGKLRRMAIFGRESEGRRMPETLPKKTSKNTP